MSDDASFEERLDICLTLRKPLALLQNNTQDHPSVALGWQSPSNGDRQLVILSALASDMFCQS